MSRPAALAIAAGALACGPDAIVDPGPAPVIASATASANPHNVLSAHVIVNMHDADSARVHFAATGGTPQATPFARVRAGTDTITALGLRPGTAYTLSVEAVGASQSVRSPEVTWTTGELPEILRSIRLLGSGAPSAGHTLVVPVFLGGDSDGYVLAFDSSGEVSWYRAIVGEGWAVEAKQQPNGNISVYVGRSYGWQPAGGRFIEFRPDGEPVRSFAAAAPYFTDPHELLMSFRDTVLEAVHLLAYDLEPYAAEETRDGRTSLAVHRILRQRPAGGVEFTWNAGAHFSTADWPAAGVPFDLVHPSSLDLDRDGNYIVSLQGIDEIDKIDARTGEVLWRFGGPQSDFTIEGDPLGGFRGQHSVRALANGNLLVLDNHPGPGAAQSRAVEYRLDPAAGRAQLVWEFRPDPVIPSPIMGSVQRLGNGNTVVGFGVAARVIEVGPDAAMRWDATLASSDAPGPLQFYRAVRMASLYEYRAP
jgi:outer membrane protein assembly factor BamB